MTGLKVTHVEAMATRNNTIWNDIDELSAVLRFGDGIICSLTLSLNSHVTSLETTFVGDEGSVFLRNWHRGYALNGQWETLGDNMGFGDQLMDFIRAVREGKHSRVDAEAVLPTMRVLDSLRRSACEK